MAMTIRRPDVAIFISSLRGGGAERVMTTLANEIAARELHVDLLLTRAEGPYLSLVSEAVRVIDFRKRRPALALGPLVRYLRKEQPRALLSALDHTNLIAVAARQLSGVQTRHIVSQRNNASIRPSLWNGAKDLPNYWLLGVGYRRSDGVIAVSDGVADSLTRHHGVPRSLIHVIYNPVVIPESSPNTDTPHPWMAMPNLPVVLGAGEFITQKGFDTLVEAFDVVRHHQQARLVILGEGQRRPELRRLVAQLGLDDHVLLPGFVKDPWAWMRRAAVFALSSRWEGLPNVLLEAMACGTPVVSTNCPSGPAEILEDGRWGRLVPVDDPAAMARAILETLNDPQNPPVVKRAADFDLKSAADRYLEILGIHTG